MAKSKEKMDASVQKNMKRIVENTDIKTMIHVVRGKTNILGDTFAEELKLH